MGLFSDLHNIKGYAISKEIDEHLISLGYVQGEPCYNEHLIPENKPYGLKKWYCGDFDVQVVIYSNIIFFYEEYTCGGHWADAHEEIPANAVESKEAFIEFLDNVFNKHADMFVNIK